MSKLSLKPLLLTYVNGLLAAMALSIFAYLLVVQQWFTSSIITMAVLLLLAAVQLVVQLVCFLHLGYNGRSRDRTLSLIFTLVMMLIIVVGSVWVMRNLDYRMGMSPEAMEEYMIEQNKKGF